MTNLHLTPWLRLKEYLYLGNPTGGHGGFVPPTTNQLQDVDGNALFDVDGNALFDIDSEP